MTAPIERLLDEVEWTPVDKPLSGMGIPFVTHAGYVKIGELSLRVYQLSDGKRIINKDDLEEFFAGFQ